MRIWKVRGRGLPGRQNTPTPRGSIFKLSRGSQLPYSNFVLLKIWYFSPSLLSADAVITDTIRSSLIFSLFCIGVGRLCEVSLSEWGGGRTGYWIPAHDGVGADAGGEFFRRRRRRRRHWTPWRGFIENVLFPEKKSIFWTRIVFAWNTNLLHFRFGVFW